jgi:hypothetical protein
MIEQWLAYEKPRNGEIDAMVAVQGKPSPFVSSTIKDERFHLVPVDFAEPLKDDYLPTKLTSEDYPGLHPLRSRKRRGPSRALVLRVRLAEQN